MGKRGGINSAAAARQRHDDIRAALESRAASG
jgi:hypothetical protein